MDCHLAYHGLVWGLMALVCATAAARPEALPRLRVSGNKRFLVTEDGRPFFWLGDTGWWIRRLRPLEVDHYLSTRASQAFTVIQVSPAYGGPAAQDYAGNPAFVKGDSDAPHETFWRNIDSIVDKAAAHGLYIVLFPLWGQDFQTLFGADAEKAHRFGLWLGKRYATRTNVLWAVSGEYDAINGYRLPITEDERRVLEAMARGLEAGHANSQLMTVHPGVARTSSLDFHAQEWLDLNMLQSGHMADAAAHGMRENHALIAHDYQLSPTKPVMDGEPMYEDTPGAIWIERDVTRPRADAEVVRRKAYWAVFAGACGHTYGHNDIYGFFVPDRPGHVVSLPEGPGQRGHWREALTAPGGVQMRYLRALMESRPFLSRIPDQSLIASPELLEAGPRHGQATRDADGSYALVYLPMASQTVSVDTSKLSGERLRAWWYDPRTGRADPIRGELRVGGLLQFTTRAEGPDWVLVLDDAARGYPAPGRGPRP